MHGNTDTFCLNIGTKIDSQCLHSRGDGVLSSEIAFQRIPTHTVYYCSRVKNEKFTMAFYTLCRVYIPFTCSEQDEYVNGALLIGILAAVSFIFLYFVSYFFI